jgi:hypothetical protein
MRIAMGMKGNTNSNSMRTVGRAYGMQKKTMPAFAMILRMILSKTTVTPNINGSSRLLLLPTESKKSTGWKHASAQVRKNEANHPPCCIGSSRGGRL